MDGWTVKIAAAAALTLAGAAGGRALGCARKLRASQLSAMRQALGRLSVGMLEKMLPLSEALLSCANPALAAVSRAMSGSDPLRAYRSAKDYLTGRDGPLSCLDEEELAVLEALFSRLGASGVSEQRLLLEEAGARLAHLEGRARQKAEEQARLYATLGLLAGLALAVCLL